MQIHDCLMLNYPRMPFYSWIIIEGIGDAEQQEQLHDIYKRFKEEIDQHLVDYKSLIEDLEEHKIELKGTMNKQSMKF